MKGYVFNVQGMMCEMCENHINDALRSFPGVQKVKADRRKENCTVVAENLDKQGVKNAIRALGYDVSECVEVKEYQKKSIFGFFKR